MISHRKIIGGYGSIVLKSRDCNTVPWLLDFDGASQTIQLLKILYTETRKGRLFFPKDSAFLSGISTFNYGAFKQAPAHGDVGTSPRLRSCSAG